MGIKTYFLRIIAGKWGGRRIDFSGLKDVRPTKDSSRETLFNWLAPVIDGANCLDLFAGSGALGFEALSRGAGSVVMVDSSRDVIKKLKENAELLQAENVDFYCARVPKDIKKLPEQVFDIVFLDPPFYQDLLESAFKELSESGYVGDKTLVYVESERKLDIENIKPQGWCVLREKKSGSVKSYLMEVTSV